MIDGAIRSGSECAALVDPATGAEWGSVDWDASFVDDAVETAERGAGIWGRKTALERADVLDRIGRAIEAHGDELAIYETLANGKPLRFTRAEVAASARWWQYYAALLRTLREHTIPLSSTKDADVRHEPVGVAVLITPFNGALSLGTWKLAPALAAGNSVIIKPPLNSPASSVVLHRIAAEAGVPREALQIVQGPAEVGARLVAHRGVDMVSFTGSTEAAKQVGGIVSGRLARFVAEAGGKSAHIVFDDADIDQAVTAVVQGVFSGSGQTCVAGSRVLVQRGVADAFMKRLRDRVSRLVVGDPASDATHLGPIASRAQYDRIVALIDQAEADGAERLIGGSAPPEVAPGFSDGFWVAPTVLRVADRQTAICRTEVFGPVMVVLEFETEEEAVEVANDSDFGLAAGFWTGSIGRVQRVSRQLEAGTVWVNTYRGMDWQTPFGGVKQSGIGSENGIEGLREFQQVKAVVQECGITPDPFGLV
ncbi:aldehyde dehydrogenase family protein [Leucobacter triazinivorans]|uniref:aldehyde dehydrogenase family protein n=1 Tax=Leucobacter triazinivorans TaxID=1784719 RepID=UPI001F100D9A|nr:aldehyde dehydrogenase family protein [Leucobacter triazinivorans]